MSNYLWQEKIPNPVTNPEELQELLRSAKILLSELEAWYPVGSSHHYNTMVRGLKSVIDHIEINEKGKRCHGYYLQCFWASHDYLIDQKEIKAQLMGIG